MQRRVTIDDTVLYFMFVRLAARARTLDSRQDWDEALAEVMADKVKSILG